MYKYSFFIIIELLESQSSQKYYIYRNNKYKIIKMDSAESNISLRDQLSLSPLQKYQKFNKAPYRAVLTIVLVFLNTIQLLTILNSNIYRNDNQYQQFVSLYFDPSLYIPTMFDDSQNFSIRDLQQLNTHFLYIISSLQNVNTTSLQYINLNNASINIVAHLQYYNNNSDYEQFYNIDINDGFTFPNSPFDTSNITTLKDFLIRISSFKLSVTNISLQYNDNFIIWKNQILYTFSDRAEIVMDIIIEPQSLKFEFPKENLTLELGTFINLLMIIFSFSSILLHYQYFRSIALQLYQYSKNIYISKLNIKNKKQLRDKTLYDNTIDWVVQNQIPFRALKWQDFLQIFDIWIITTTIGNIFQLVSSILLVFRSKNTSLIGIACMISWLVLFKFLKRYKKMVLLNEVLSMSIPKLLIFMVQFIPTFMAFLVFGTTVFWKVQIFKSARRTLATQMCLLLGDSICYITMSICQFHTPWIAIYYSFTFVLLFMQAIHNLLIGLIKQQFILNKIILGKRQMKQKGQYYVPVSELKMQGDVEKEKLPIKYSREFEAKMIRKIYKERQDNLIESLERIFNIAEQEIKILIRDFDEDIRFSDLNKSEQKIVKQQLKYMLLKLNGKIEKLTERCNQQS